VQALQAELAERRQIELALRTGGSLQAAALELAQNALGGAPLSVLVQEVLGTLGRALAADAVALWDRGQLGSITLVAEQGDSRLLESLAFVAEYATRIGEPVTVENLTDDLRFRGLGGLELACLSALTAPVCGDGQPTGILGVASSTTRTFTQDEVAFLCGVGRTLGAAMARTHATSRLEQQALTDPLTGLANRSLFHDRLQQAVRVAARERQVVALLLIDLDRFKDVNDTLGHHWGDVLLKEVSRRLRAAVRPSDTVARLGGDEFAVILPASGDLANVSRLAGKLLEAMEQPVVLDDRPADVRGSIGVVLYPEHGDRAEDLLRRADVAMYVAKQAGGGFAVYAPEHDEHDPAQLALAGELRRALEAGDELVVRLQPQVDLRHRAPCGFEAQLRWQHPTLGGLDPDQFMPLAERTGLVKPLDRFALGAAIEACRSWRAAGWSLPVSVNISPRSLLDVSLPAFVADMCRQHSVPPSAVTLEVAEGTIMTEPGKVIQVLLRLRALGVGIAIDEFGTGYSSLASLKRLPVSTLTIDKSFVRDMAADKGDLAIVRSVVELGHSFGLRVVADGVDTLATLRLLQQLDCDEARGTYVSGPLSVVEALAWLNTCPSVTDAGPSAEAA
jgi:diguanylate cyclase (GGDEF)-like protein